MVETISNLDFTIINTSYNARLKVWKHVIIKSFGLPSPVNVSMDRVHDYNDVIFF